MTKPAPGISSRHVSGPVRRRMVKPPVSGIQGLGDVIHAVALPIARVLGLPCVDPDTRQLRPESACAERRKRLNAAVPLR